MLIPGGGSAAVVIKSIIMQNSILVGQILLLVLQVYIAAASIDVNRKIPSSLSSHSTKATNASQNVSHAASSNSRLSRPASSNRSRSGTPYWTAFLNISYVDTVRKVWHTERTETGRFSGGGAVREATGVAAEIVSSADGDDKTACDPPFDRARLPAAGRPWIAIVRRGGCTFNEKISNALALNASGVLVYDNEDGGALESMKVERFPIPSVFTYNWKGEEILGLMGSVGDVYLTLQEGSHCHPRGPNNEEGPYCTYSDSWREFLRRQQGGKPSNGSGGNRGSGRTNSGGPYFGWNLTGGGGGHKSGILGPTSGGGGDATLTLEKRTSVLFVSVSFIVLMVISLAWLVFYYVQRFRYLHAKDQLERKLCGQAKRALSIISTSVVKKDDLVELTDFGDTCAVCLEQYRVADVVRVLPCRHRFHKGCIDQWLLEKRTCPMCKMDILKHYGLVDDDDDEEGEIAHGRSRRSGPVGGDGIEQREEEVALSLA